MGYVIANHKLADNFYFKLESDHPAASQFMGNAVITISESMHSLVPYMVMEYDDQYGDLFNFLYVNPKYPMRVSVGVSEANSMQASFLPASNTMINSTATHSNQMGMKLVWMHPAWLPLTRDEYSRVFKNARFSDIVAEIAEEADLTADVEQTAKSSDVIQPLWTNQKFIKWMLPRCANESGLGGYRAWTRLDNRLVFATLDRQLQRDPVAELVLSTNDASKVHKIGQLKLEQNYASKVAKGAFGVNGFCFNYNSKSWAKEARSIEDNETRQKSTKVYMAKDHSGGSRCFVASREDDVGLVSNNIVLDAVFGSQTVTVQLHGDYSIHAGDMVTLDLYAKTDVQAKRLTNYSGPWLVQEVKHVIDMDIASFHTYLTLSEFGINKSVYTDNHFDDLTETKTGKA